MLSLPNRRGPSTARALLRPLAATALVVLAAGLVACGRSPATLEVDGPTMGTYYSVKVANPPVGLTGEELQRGVAAALDEVIAEISTYDAASELSRLNRNPDTDWVAVSPQLHRLLAAGLELSELTAGAFDVTVGPLVNLWGFGPEINEESVPSPEAVAAALERVGHRMIALRADPPAVRRARGDLYIDLSALGEGWGADRVAEHLESRGVTDYMVAVAGSIRMKGRNGEGAPWRIAVEEPTPGRRAVHRILAVTDAGLSTSGDYRNFFEEGGRRYSHHIDPRTGAPVRHSLASVTVVSDTATEADGLATALLLLGEKKGPALAAAEGIAAYFIVRTDEGFEVTATPDFERFLAP